jgi:hypothetical protein
VKDKDNNLSSSHLWHTRPFHIVLPVSLKSRVQKGNWKFNPLTPNDLQRRRAVSPLKIKIPSKNMREKPPNAPIIHSFIHFGITLPSSGSLLRVAQLWSSRWNIADGRVVSSGVVRGNLRSPRTTKKLPDDGRLLSKYLGAIILSKGVVKFSA